MTGFVADIEHMADDNVCFRRVVYTGKQLQLVLMSLPPGEEIGEEVHRDRDQHALAAHEHFAGITTE